MPFVVATKFFISLKIYSRPNARMLPTTKIVKTKICVRQFYEGYIWNKFYFRLP